MSHEADGIKTRTRRDRKSSMEIQIDQEVRAAYPYAIWTAMVM